MRKLRAILLLLVLAAGQWPPGMVPAAVAAPPAAARKVARWVAEQTAGGQEAEFLVVLTQQAALSAAAHLPTRQARAHYVFETLLHTAQSTQGPLLAWLAAQGVPHRSFYIVNLIWVRGDARLVAQLAARADVARLDANPQVSSQLGQPTYGPALPLAAPDSIEANISYVHAPDVWSLGYTGQGIVIGGQDTGYQWDHPALKLHYRGWNGSTADHNYNWHDSIHTDNADCDGDSPAPCDDHGHGTHTLGTAVGDDGATNQIGMAPDAQWIGCRNMNNGVGTPATYLECFEWFLAPYPIGGIPADGNPDLAPDVTNNSWGCPPLTEGCAINTLQAAVEAQRAAGIFTVVSAGNNGPSCSTIFDPPAFYDAAYTVGALVKGTDTIASLSSRGPVLADGSQRPKPDIAAPGTSIRSSVPVNGYASLSGTSMAVPHVVGAVALLWSARPAARGQIALTEDILNQSAAHIASGTCDAVVTGPNNTYGYGRLDVLAAVNSVPGQAGTLSGTVTSTIGRTPVLGVNVLATLVATPTLSFELASDANGVLTNALFTGVYTLTLTHPLYTSTTLAGVTILSDTTTTVDISLTPLNHFVFPLIQKNAVP